MDFTTKTPRTTPFSGMFPPDGPDLGELLNAAHREPLGLYVHIPFCRDHCTYCSFMRLDHRSPSRPGVLHALNLEIQSWGEALGKPKLDTLYFGGGTPSVLTEAELRQLWDSMAQAFDLEGLEEATLEANPGTVDLAWLQGARALGFDRISFGVQSLQNSFLKTLGRSHCAEGALESMAWAQEAGFKRISADLMVGIPGQPMAAVLGDARRLVDAGARHLSVYCLDLDKACALQKAIQVGRCALPSEDEVADTFEALQEALPTLGLFPYEISNYAAPGQESRHNNRYWERRPYLGLGPSAASQMGAWRWSLSSHIPTWMYQVKLEECQHLSPKEALAEIPLLGLRKHQGVLWEDLRKKAQEAGLLELFEAWEGQLQQAFEHGLLGKDGQRIYLTPKGMLLSNHVFEIFV